MGRLERVANDDARVSGSRREIGEVTRVSGHVRGIACVHEPRISTGGGAGRRNLLESGKERQVPARLLGGRVGQKATIGQRVGRLRCSEECLMSLQTRAEQPGGGGTTLAWCRRAPPLSKG
jgi:hypothetical protein